MGRVRFSIASPEPADRQALPRRRPKQPASRAGERKTRKRTQEPPQILVVEDDFLVAMQIETALTEAGFAVAGSAATAEEAIELALAKRPALAVMDVRLAGKRDGVEAALQLFREHGIRSVFATAHHDPELRQRATPAAPLGWLQKPYAMASLVQAIRRALGELAGGRKK